MGLALPDDVRLLAEIYAFGATLAIAIAHLSIVRLRWTEPDRERPYRIPFNLRIRGRQLPVPALLGVLLIAFCGLRYWSSTPAPDGWAAAGWSSA